MRFNIDEIWSEPQFRYTLFLILILFVFACSNKSPVPNQSEIKVEVVSDKHFGNMQEEYNNFFKILHQKGETVKTGTNSKTKGDGFTAWLEETYSRSGIYNLIIQDDKTGEKYIAYTLDADNPNFPPIDSFGSKIVVSPFYDAYLLYDVKTKKSSRISYPEGYSPDGTLLYEDYIISGAQNEFYKTKSVMVYNLKNNKYSFYKILQGCFVQEYGDDPYLGISSTYISENGKFYWRESSAAGGGTFYSVLFKDLEYIKGC